MPELPEVERAARTLRAAVEGRVVARLRFLHPSLRARLPAARLRALAGARIARVERRGKHQLVHLDDGRILHVHFRMSGDWLVDRTGDPVPRFARALLELADGARLVLVDPRALATIALHPADAPPSLALGPEPDDPALDERYLAGALAARRGPIKPVLLDQRVVAGLGNIYAAEALWEARLSPHTPANALSATERRRLIQSMRRVIARATGARYRDAGAAGLAVYDREGAPCARCDTPIVRAVQAGRSTYWCPRCQPSLTDLPSRR